MNIIDNAVSTVGKVGALANETTSVVGSIGRLTNAIADGTIGQDLAPKTWRDLLQKASFAGVPFAVESVRTTAGRKTAVHDYPFRDDVWVEDLGKKARQFEVQGFLVENDAVTGGGQAIAQRNALLAACETGGPAKLVHPTLGTIENVVCLSVDIEERADLGGAFSFRLSLTVSGKEQYPKQTPAKPDAVHEHAKWAWVAAVQDFVHKTEEKIKHGAEVIQKNLQTARDWYDRAMRVVNDVKRVIGSVSTLVGDFGRLFGGGNNGFAGSNFPAQVDKTVTDLLGAATATRNTVISAGAILRAAAANPSDAETFGSAVQTLVSAVASAANDPADAVRMISNLAQYSPTPVTTPGPIGAAMADMQVASAALFRRVALAQLAVTLTTYQPSSQDDANAVLSSALALIDTEIATAGDTGDDNTYQALRALRQSVVADLGSRGADLAAISTFSFQASLPSLVLATRIYRDPSREPELVQQIAPIHPAFCPTTFDALAS